MTLTVSGGSCTWNLRPNGKTRLSSIKVTARPKNGSASAGVNSVVYTAKPGFKGSDSFAVAVTGQGAAGTPGTANISVSVNVQ
jgi:Bacterial Ig domain